MSTLTVPARPARRPRPLRRTASSHRGSCRGSGTALRVLPDGSIRIPPAALRDAALRDAALRGRARRVDGTAGRPVLTLAFAPAPAAPVARVTPTPVQVPRVAPAASLRLVPAPGLATTAPLPARLPRPLLGRPETTPRVGGRPVAGPPVRLTRRGRLLLTLLATIVLVAAVIAGVSAVRPLTGHGPSVSGLALPHLALPRLALPHLSIPGAGGGPVSARRVTVRPGDTLWAIAQRSAPGADPRDTVATIEALNHLSSSDVQVGMVLRVPAAR